jgi:hypothetical protein
MRERLSILPSFIAMTVLRTQVLMSSMMDMSFRNLYWMPFPKFCLIMFFYFTPPTAEFVHTGTGLFHRIAFTPQRKRHPRGQLRKQKDGRIQISYSIILVTFFIKTAGIRNCPAFAVFILMIKSNFFPASMGIEDGFAPFNIRAAFAPDSRPT